MDDTSQPEDATGSDAGEQPAAEPTAGQEPAAEPELQALRDEVAAVRADLARAENRYRRALADLDNYRKRTERDAGTRIAQARRAVMHDWLDALDSVERAMRVTPDDPGLTAVWAQMEGILARLGVSPVVGVGAAFDPVRHEAVEVKVTDEVPDRTIVDVLRSGYQDGDEVIRPAQVAVSRRTPGG